MSAEFNPRYTASSIMMEEVSGGVRIYAAQNLGRSLLVSQRDEPQFLWNQEHLPWMEGDGGDGVGQSVELLCDKAFSALNILNGYVNLQNPDLFRENGRAKSLLIEDLDNGVLYQMDLKDEICFSGIQLKRATTRVRLTITAVYSGSKHSDVCISAIIPEETPSTFYFQGQTDNRAVGVGRKVQEKSW